MLDVTLTIAVALRCDILADRLVWLYNNPPTDESAITLEYHGYDRGIVLGEIKGLVSLMNELTGSSVDPFSFVDAAWVRANEG